METQIDSKAINSCDIYRPPRSKVNKMAFMTFLDIFSDHLTNIINDHKNLII